MAPTAAAIQPDRSRRFDRMLAAVTGPCHESREKAQEALTAFHARERAKLQTIAIAEQPESRVVRFLFPDPDAATVDIATPGLAVVEPQAPTYRDAEDQAWELVELGGRDAELAGVRAQLRSDHEVGPVEMWGALVELDGQYHTQIFRGSLSALQRLFPDEYTRERWHQAGAKGLEQHGRPLQIERYGRCLN